ncbi:type II pantothenate kinase [Virgibacillus siamensis]|uniref:type II pantothenate kinase n=1 Tax=Virgibacillus siamensis TaxID=480071 RepID=UPI000986BCE9|nr:type II pantothenate kinase [Virgibacillus siamensis]
MDRIKAGIDAGGTLIKIVYEKNGIINYRSFRSIEIEDAVEWLTNRFDHVDVCVTGGKSKVLKDKWTAEVKTVVEFDATAKGIEFLAKQHEFVLDAPYLFVNAGTGTSIHYVSDHKQVRIGGSGIGGGTLVGLSQLVTGIKDYETIVQLAIEGDRDKVDLKVKDIFEGALPPISGDLTASNFGSTAKMLANRPANKDVLASIIGMIGEVIVSITTPMTVQYDVDTVVYIGSTFRSNPLLQETVSKYTTMLEKNPIFLPDGEYSGAVGAMLALD